MFTGLVQGVARIRRIPTGVQLRLEPGAGSLDPGTLHLGDSVAVDGVCLTVAQVMGDGFRADVSEETLRRSTLAEKADRAAWVNLEPALRLSDRLGGHLVSGHVDGQGRVTGIHAERGSWRLELAWNDPAMGRYICDKASVTVDGISLTVAGCEPHGAGFWMAVIPHTWSSTTLRDRRVGDRVNLEADLLAKYTERLLLAARQTAGMGMDHSSPAHLSPDAEPPISTAWLAEQGWLAG